MSKPHISLIGHAGTGVIIEHPTGVIYSNQAGGTACLHPEIEGTFVPFGNDVLIEQGRRLLSPQDDLESYFEGPKHRGTGATNGLDAEDADFIDGVLQRAHVRQWIEVDRDRLKESCEAWVFVTVLGDESSPFPICSGFGPYPKRGVLTWVNSD